MLALTKKSYMEYDMIFFGGVLKKMLSMFMHKLNVKLKP